MTTPTQRLGLIVATTADPFRTADYEKNWKTLDAAPGILICTSTTRPTTWNTNHEGRLIEETDTGLLWRWTGTSFVRVFAVGHLATARITSQRQTTSTSGDVAITQDVTALPGGRRLQISVSAGGVYSTVDLTRLTLRRDATNLRSWLQHGRLTSDPAHQPTPLSMTVFDEPTTGPHTYSLVFGPEPGYAGTSTIQAGLDNPITLSVVEV